MKTGNSTLRRFLAALRADNRAVTIIEFAFALPLLIMTFVGGMEVVNIVIVNTRVNQIALALADNASRMKQETVSGAPRIREYDVNQAFRAAEIQGGDLGLLQKGRLILSSLETNDSGGQWIHWQRCVGSVKTYKSSFGVQGTGGKTGTSLKGVQFDGNVIKAEKDAAIMLAEVVYDYQPLIVDGVMDKMTVRKTFAMGVRDDRDLTGDGIWNVTPASTKNTC
jgi:hypothetical protein